MVKRIQNTMSDLLHACKRLNCECAHIEIYVISFVYVRCLMDFENYMRIINFHAVPLLKIQL